MKWMITKEHFGNEQQLIGLGNIPTSERLPAGRDLPFEFRLMDDDNCIYYEGRCEDITDTDSEHAFAPLNWGEAHAGCTMLEYRKVGTADWYPL